MKNIIVLLALLISAPVMALDLNPSLDVGVGLTTNGDTVETNKAIGWVEGKLRAPIYENVQPYMGLSYMGNGSSKEATPRGGVEKVDWSVVGLWWGLELPASSKIQFDGGVGIQFVNVDSGIKNEAVAGFRAGVNYDLTDQWSIGAKYVYITNSGIDGFGTGLATVGYRF